MKNPRLEGSPQGRVSTEGPDGVATAGLPEMENEGTIAATRSIVEPMKHRQWLAGRCVRY